MGGFADEAGEVYAEAFIPEGLQVGYAAVDVVDGAAIVAQAQLVEADADAQDPLIYVADGAWLYHPDLFEGLVLREVFSTVKLLQAGVEEGGRSFLARPGEVGARG